MGVGLVMSQSRKRRRNRERAKQARRIELRGTRRSRKLLRMLDQSVRLNIRYALMVFGALTFIQGLGLWTTSLLDRAPFLLAGMGLFGLAYLHRRFFR